MNLGQNRTQTIGSEFWRILLEASYVTSLDSIVPKIYTISLSICYIFMNIFFGGFLLGVTFNFRILYIFKKLVKARCTPDEAGATTLEVSTSLSNNKKKAKFVSLWWLEQVKKKFL